MSSKKLVFTLLFALTIFTIPIQAGIIYLKRWNMDHIKEKQTSNSKGAISSICMIWWWQTAQVFFSVNVAVLPALPTLILLGRELSLTVFVSHKNKYNNVFCLSRKVKAELFS